MERNILDSVVKVGACWEWQRGRHRQGYGQFTRGGKTLLAHRTAYEVFCGPIPEGMCVRHRCDNPPCVNPTHLILGTHTDNMRDASERRRLHKLTASQVEDAKRLRASGGTEAEVSKLLGVSGSTLRKEAPLGHRASGERHGRAKLTQDQVRVIRDRCRIGERKTRLAEEFGVSVVTINRIASGRARVGN